MSRHFRKFSARTPIALLIVSTVALTGVSAPSVAFAGESVEAPTNAETSPAPPEASSTDDPFVAPAVIGQPEDVTATSGNVAEFTVTYDAPEGTAVRWQQLEAGTDATAAEVDQWQDIDVLEHPSAASPTLRFDTVTLGQSGTHYRAVVGDDTFSETALLTVAPEPEVTDSDTDAPTDPQSTDSDPAAETETQEMSPDAERASETPESSPDSTDTGSGQGPADLGILGSALFGTGGLSSIFLNESDGEDFSEIAAFTNPRTVTVYRGLDNRDAPAFTDPATDVLYSGDLVRLAGGGVSSDYRSDAPENTNDYRPYFAWRWGGSGEWTYKSTPINSPTVAAAQRADADVPPLPVGSARQNMIFEFAVVYKEAGDLPQQFVNYWQTTFRVAPDQLAPEEESDEFTDVAPFTNPRTLTVFRKSLDNPVFADPLTDALYGGDLLRIAGGGVSDAYRSDAPENTNDYRPYFAWRWGGSGDWTINASAITSATTAARQRADITVPSLSAEQNTRFEFAVVYKAVGDLPQQFVHYWQTSFQVVPEPIAPEPLDVSISKAPQDLTVTVGESASFSIEVSGYPTVSATPQIRTQEMRTSFDPGSAITNGFVGDEYRNTGVEYATFPAERRTTSEYRIAAVTPEMDGMTVEFWTSDSRMTSNPHGWPEKIAEATLQVTGYEQPSDWAAPTITVHPQSVAQEPDAWGLATAILPSEAVGTPTPNVQWQRMLPGGAWTDLAASDISSTFSPTLFLTGDFAIPQAQSGVQFRAKYTNRLGSVYSDPATVLVRGELPEGSYWGESDPMIQYSAPTGVEAGTSMTVSGKRWLNTSQRNTGSVIAIRLDGVEAGGEVRHPVTGEPLTDPTIIAAVKANAVGAWTATLPLPTDWKPGDTHTIRLSTGELGEDDNERSESHEVEIWQTAELAEIIADLPETFEVPVIGDATISLTGTAPTPITYEWQYRPLGGEWTDLPKNGENGLKATGNSLAIIYIPANSRAQLEGTEVRALLTTRVGSVQSKTATIRIQSNASISYDTSRTYHLGDTIQVTGSGFPAASSVQLQLGGSTLRVTTDARGTFSSDITVPGYAYNSASQGTLRGTIGGAWPITAAYGQWDGSVAAIGAPVMIAADPAVAAPTITDDFPDVYEIAEGSEFTLEPSVSGTDVRYYWFITPSRSGYFSSADSYRDTATLAQHDQGTITVVAYNAGGFVTLNTEIDVIPADGSPSRYDFVTATTEDDAVIYVEQNVEPGGSARITGRGWTKTDDASGSLIAVKLNYRYLDDETGQYERTGEDILSHPLSGSPDSTIWAIVQAAADGTFQTTIDLPDNLRAGQRLAVALSSGVFANDDVSRMVVTPSLTVGGEVWEEPTVDVVACTPSTASPTWNVQEQTELGGTLKLSGQGWCNLRSGGSTIAIKIDDGTYSHLTDELNSNRTIWAIVHADDETGDWEAEIQLPDGTTSGPQGSTPAFTEGEHSIRFLTGSLKDYDPIRTVGTPTGQNTSFVVGEYQPNAMPAPLDIDGGELTAGNKNGVTVQQQATPAPGQWVVTVPGGQAGDYVYIDAYAGSSSRSPFPDWYRLDANKQVKLSLAGVTLAAGKLSVTVQNGNQGQVGELLGWATVTINAPQSDTPAVKPPPAKTVTPSTSAAPAGTGVRYASNASSMPATIPALPVKRGSQLDTTNAGKVTGVIADNIVTLTVADGTPNQWIYAYIYTGAQSRPIGWVQLDENLQMKVDISELPDGNHKVALVGADGELIGWASAAKGEITAAVLQQEQIDEARAQAAETTALDGDSVVVDAMAWLPNVLLAGGALLLLGGAVAAALVLRNRRNQL